MAANDGDHFAQQLIEIEDRLSRPDAIIDPEIIQSLRQYPALSLQVHGQQINDPQQKQLALKQYLSDGQSMLVSNYCGYTKVCNLLLDWTKHIVEDSKEIHHSFVQILKESAIELYKEQNGEENITNINAYKQEITDSIEQITKKYGDTKRVQRGFNLIDFEQKFGTFLKKILNDTKGTESDYERKCHRFIQFCCRNELFFLHSRRLLFFLKSAHAKNAKLQFMLAKIEFKMDEFIKNHNQSNRAVELCIFAKGISFDSPLRIPCIELLRNGSFTKADVRKVYEYYVENKDVTHLQNEGMIDYFYRILFIPSSENAQLNKKYISQYLFLLNMALSDGTMQKDDQMTAVSEICRDKNYGVTLSENGQKQNILFEGIKQEKIARGVLMWINFCMYTQHETYFADNFEAYLTPLLVSLIAQIAKLHDFLRPNVVKFAYAMVCSIGDQTTSTLGTKSAASFDAKTSSFSSIKNMEFIKRMLDLIVFMIQIGEYVLVFSLVKMDKLTSLDRSLHRHFIEQIVKTIFDPLPTDFVCEMFKLLTNTHILAAIRNDADTAKLVIKFVSEHESVSSGEAENILTQLKKK